MQSLSSSSSSSTDPSLRPVHLYVYDLSNGLARSMSMSWTVCQFDGIWHTSVVFDNQLEVFFGQGIMTSRPGNSHIGKPLRVIDQGETMIDPVTFEDYIEGLRSSWNAQSYHLLERNCNNFSKEVLSFLNGSDVPDYILSLPHQFLSTPLGASMRPVINQIFRLGSGHSNHHQINQPLQSAYYQTSHLPSTTTATTTAT
ncbi:PPPDE putative peptidase domain-containing protein [Phakopsora pachyrhizi]|nr:PPPDE putative peptidase domain-containing protein [Phakopsora pachyrhizi]